MDNVSRAVIVVMDSVGCGEMPDAYKYGDVGSNTIGNVWKKMGGIHIPNLIKLGLGRIPGLEMLPSENHPTAAFGKMAEVSAGKDTTTGHWEISGLRLDKPFPLYPDGFPKEIIDQFISQTGCKGVLGNKPASGTVIIEELGREHMETGYPIVYTSADSVFQIAAHEEVIPVEKLYEYCRIARKILTGNHGVGRVIARPFTGSPGKFRRTENRKDFSLEPVGETILDIVSEAGMEVAAVGKIEDIFAGRGITRSVHTHKNSEGVDQTIKFLAEDFPGLIFVNLVDFDMLYGHRNDVEGYAVALEEFDRRIAEIIGALKEEDVLFITADHGCDPTTPSTDHSREYVPLLVYGKKVRAGVDLGLRRTFADIAATAAELLDVRLPENGTSFAGELF